MIAANLTETMSWFARSQPGGQILDVVGIRIIDAGPVLDMFNTALLTGPVLDEADLSNRLEAASRYFGDRHQQWSLWLCDTFVPKTVRAVMSGILDQFDLRITARMPGMSAASVRVDEVAPELRIRRVADTASRKSFCHILALTFDGPSGQMSAMYNRPELWSGSFRGYIGSVDGTDVCAGLAVATPDSLGLYALATLPAFTRRGYAAAVVRRAVEDSRQLDGNLPIVLQSTQPAAPLYRRLGFEPKSEFFLYGAS